MYNDSVETLLLRHYGSNAPAPSRLEARLMASLRREATARREQELANARIQTYRLSRRRAVKLVAMSSAGLGVMTMGLDMVNQTLFGAEQTRAALL